MFLCVHIFVILFSLLYGILVVLDILTNTHDYWLLTYVQYCTVYESVCMAVGAPLRTPLGSLQRPPESRLPRKTHKLTQQAWRAEML